MPAPAQAPAQPHPGTASADADGARRREAAQQEQDADQQVSRRSAVAHAYTAAGRTVEEPPEERPGISVLA